MIYFKKFDGTIICSGPQATMYVLMIKTPELLDWVHKNIVSRNWMWISETSLAIEKRDVDQLVALTLEAGFEVENICR